MAQLPQPPNMQVINQSLQGLAVELPRFLNIPVMAQPQALQQQMQKGFDDINARFDDINARFDDINERFDGVDTRINRLTNQVRRVRRSIADFQRR